MAATIITWVVISALLIVMGGPAEAPAVSGMIVLALNDVLRAAKVEAEDFIGKIQPLHIRFDSLH